MRLRTLAESVVKAVASIFTHYWWVFALVLVIYVPTLRASFIWDDEQFIYKNFDIRSFDLGGMFTHNTVGGAGVASGYYRPLTSLSFALDWLLSQGNPAWLHLMNVLWHVAAGVALAGFLEALGLPVLISLIIFLLHPLQTEAVAYISGRGDPLSMFFGFMSMWALAKYLQHKKHLTNLLCSFVAFALAVLSKESAVVFAGLAALILLRPGRKHWQLLLIYGAIALVAILLRIAVVGMNLGFHWDGVYGASMWIRFLTFTRVFSEYIRLIMIPYPLHMERFVPLVTPLLSPWPWISLGTIALIALVGIKLEIRNRWQYWFGVLWFGVFLIPQSGVLIPAPALMTEHWLYGSLPGLGIAVEAFVRTRRLDRLKYVGFLIVCLWVVIGIRQSYLWADPIRFYEYTLRYARTARLHNNLGMHYAETGRVEDAQDQYLLALRLGDYPQIHYNLGNLYGETGRREEAKEEYRKALTIAPDFILAKEKLRMLEASPASGFR